ncbi:hypothetical protein NDU88_004588 [Pleurodeles waltl]|uniref:Uncharacterized protein n=1 Tax=Pleurodeles waltl TaxID=8319 RepID=A0AAV7M7J7_PLEWA|nr:hypothetical protein NDU88_004588 [Pleurodeles waltl]
MQNLEWGGHAVLRAIVTSVVIPLRGAATARRLLERPSYCPKPAAEQGPTAASHSRSASSLVPWPPPSTLSSHRREKGCHHSPAHGLPSPRSAARLRPQCPAAILVPIVKKEEGRGAECPRHQPFWLQRFLGQERAQLSKVPRSGIPPPLVHCHRSPQPVGTLAVLVQGSASGRQAPRGHSTTTRPQVARVLSTGVHQARVPAAPRMVTPLLRLHPDHRSRQPAWIIDQMFLAIKKLVAELR